MQLLRVPTAAEALDQMAHLRDFKRQHPSTLKAIFEQFGYKKAEQRDPLIKLIKDGPAVHQGSGHLGEC